MGPHVIIRTHPLLSLLLTFQKLISMYAIVKKRVLIKALLNKTSLTIIVAHNMVNLMN